MHCDDAARACVGEDHREACHKLRGDRSLVFGCAFGNDGSAGGLEAERRCSGRQRAQRCRGTDDGGGDHDERGARERRPDDETDVLDPADERVRGDELLARAGERRDQAASAG